MKSKLIRGGIEYVIAFILVFFLTSSNIFSSLNYMLNDKIYQIPRGVTGKIKIIGIDDYTLERFGRIDTWSRGIYADLINMLNSNEEAKPSVIAFDILFSGEVDEGDEEFAAAAADSGNVVVCSKLIYEDSHGKRADDETYKVSDVIMPFEALGNVVKTGYSNMSVDSDGTVRRINLTEDINGSELGAFSKTIYALNCQNEGKTERSYAKNKYGSSMINYSGRPGSYEYISLIDLLDGKIDTRTFKDSIVLVGAYANDMQDNFSVPNGGTKEMYGVEIHANIIEALDEESFPVQVNPYLLGFIYGIISVIILFIYKRINIWISAVVSVIVVAVQFFVGAYLNNRGHYISLLYFPIGVFIIYIYCLAVSYLIERFRRKKVLRAFRKYVAPEVVREIASKGDFKVALSGETRDIAVLFVDIRGFTTMSEALPPETVVEILNKYLDVTAKAIFENKGTLDKFVGDAAMAVFNSPFDLDDYEYRAVCAAKAIVNYGKELSKTLEKEYGRTIGFGVGVNVGPAVVGNIGCAFRVDYTAIGDTVNTAARLEANAGSGQIYISEELYNRVKDRVEVEPVGEIPLKGKKNGVFVYAVKA